TRGFVLSRESPETIQLEIPLRAPYLSKRALKANSYNMRHQFLARLERIFAAPFFLRGRERKCSVPQGGAKVLLTQKELSRLTCPAARDAAISSRPAPLRLGLWLRPKAALGL